jgi:hypothetical protein
MGVNTASLSALAEGGTSGYTYEWDDNPTLPQTTATATALLAGTYTITVTDSKGCIASDTRDINTITNTMEAQVVSLIQYIGGNDISCFGEDDGAALVTAWGAHGPYSYQWYGPNGYASTNDTISNLLAGVYSVTVKDTNDCMANSSINLIEPISLIFTSLFSTDETCLGSCNGTIGVNLTGGNAPYSGHLYNNNTGYMLIDLLSGDSLFGGICSGDYTIGLSDANGCLSALSLGGNNQVIIIASDTITTQIDTSYISPLCAGDSTVEINMTLGSFDSSYSHNWINTADPTTSLGDGYSIDSVPAGTYVLQTNYLGCQSSDTMVVTAPDLIQISAAITNAICHGGNNGSIDASIVGGTLGSSNTYNLLWSTNATTEEISNLIAGSYTLSATDSYGCEGSIAFQVTEPQVLACSVTQDQPNGYVLTASIVTGGTPSYNYSWREQTSPNNSIGTGTTYIVTNYGTYYAVVKDVNNCTLETNSFEYKDVTATGNELTNLDLSIYPNPFREETTVDFGRDIKQATISVVDIFGKHIEEYNITNTNKHIISRNNKASGIYFVEIQVEQQETVMFKLIIE